MCRVCDSAARVRRAADALVAACVETAGHQFSGDDRLSPELRRSFEIDPATPDDLAQLVGRLDRTASAAPHKTTTGSGQA